VALGRGPLVEADMKAGRLVAPFDVKLSSDSAYYVVAPAERMRRPKIKAFVTWLRDTVAREKAAS
jgi:LysR family glycine cleavage system transcriptional activator